MAASAGRALPPHISDILVKIFTVLSLFQLVDAKSSRRRLLQSSLPSSSASKISPGYDTFYAIAPSSGALFTWGAELASLTGAVKLTPTLFNAGPWTQVGAGLRYACALDTAGTGYCWGAGSTGELGSGELTARSAAPTPVQTTSSFRQLSVGGSHVCGVTSDSKLLCWGESGGAGTSSDVGVPTAVAGANWSAVSSGNGQTCAIKSDATLWCWGANNYRQASPSNETTLKSPTQVPGKWAWVSCGDQYTLAVKTDGAAMGWGLSESVDADFATGGMLGSGKPMCYNPETEAFCSTEVEEMTPEPTDEEYYYDDDNYFADFSSFEAEPVAVAGGFKFSSVSAGGAISCGVEQSTGRALCWGYTTGEAYAAGSPMTNIPVPIANYTATAVWDSLTVGFSNARCGYQNDQSLWCWGRKDYNCEGECPLGDGTAKNSAVPKKVLLPAAATAPAAAPPPPTLVTLQVSPATPALPPPPTNAPASPPSPPSVSSPPPPPTSVSNASPGVEPLSSPEPAAPPPPSSSAAKAVCALGGGVVALAGAVFL